MFGSPGFCRKHFIRDTLPKTNIGFKGLPENRPHKGHKEREGSSLNCNICNVFQAIWRALFQGTGFWDGIFSAAMLVSGRVRVSSSAGSLII